MVTHTKICAFMTQKGGAGKSVLTNLICNEIILWHLLNKGDKVSVLVVDIDPQKTSTMKRKQDVGFLKFETTTPEFQALTSDRKTEIGRLQRRYALLLDSGFSAYKLTQVDLESNARIESVVANIHSGEFDYVFIDFPGTLSEKGSGVFLQLVQHIFIPTCINPSDILGTEYFLKTLFKLGLEFKSVHLVWNKFEVSRQRKTNDMEQYLLGRHHIPFFTTRIPYSPMNDCNTLIPASLNVNLNLNTYSIIKPSLQDLAEEIITSIE